MEIYTNFILKRESDLWIFNHCNSVFDEYTISIKIERFENNSSFICIGTFVKDNNDNLIFRIFIRQQLIDFSNLNNNSMTILDRTEFKCYIFDTCDETLICKVFLNDSKNPNLIKFNYMLPLNEDTGFMIGGTGDKCLLKSFICKSVDHLEVEKTLNKIISKSQQENDEKIKNNKNSNCKVM